MGETPKRKEREKVNRPLTWNTHLTENRAAYYTQILEPSHWIFHEKNVWSSLYISYTVLYGVVMVVLELLSHLLLGLLSLV